MPKKVCLPLGPLCEGAPPAGGGGENCTAARNISGYGKVLSLRPFGAPPSQREVFRHAERARKRPLFCVSKASPAGLRPQARVEAQPPEAALSAETEAAARRRLMRAELATASREWVIAAHSPLIRPRAGPRPPSPAGEGNLAYSSSSSSKISCATSPRLMRVSMARFSIRRWASVSV